MRVEYSGTLGKRHHDAGRCRHANKSLAVVFTFEERRAGERIIITEENTFPLAASTSSLNAPQMVSTARKHQLDAMS